MTEVVASAPGKIILCGEYAVLDGAAALCLAVDRRAIVRLASTAARASKVRAPGYSDVAGVFTSRQSEITWESGGEDFSLFEHVWRSAGVFPEESLEITLDTSAFRDAASGKKIGVGSSAALTVALARALESQGGGNTLEVAQRAHRNFQGGRGSGADIACSHLGGVIEYRITDPGGRSRKWPEGLYYAIFWSGVPADTRGRIERLSQLPDLPSRRRLGDAANHCASTFGCGDDFMDGLREYCDVLRHFDDEHGLGVFDGGHAALTAPAASHGIVYKPCGAGGGDVGIALAHDEESLASFAAVAAGSGFHRLEMFIDPEGAAVSQRP